LDNLVYEDDTSPGPMFYNIFWTQLILPYLPIFAILMILMYSFNLGDWLFDHPVLFPVIYSPAFVFVWMRIPEKYQIFDDRIKILLHRPFHFYIPFDDIVRAGEGEEPGFWFHIGLNYITAIGQNNIYIVRDPKMTVNITPEHPKLFLENLKKAMDEWKLKSPDMKEELLEPLYSDGEELD
jgi:hypothetical protein